MGFMETLTIVFIVLKLIGVINWSWWLVLLPELIMIALYIVIFIIAYKGDKWYEEAIESDGR